MWFEWNPNISTTLSKLLRPIHNDLHCEWDALIGLYLSRTDLFYGDSTYESK